MTKLSGVDLCEVEGISEVTIMELIAEKGTDINQWKSEKHFTAWLNLCPNTKISEGKIN
jgi:transposase